MRLLILSFCFTLLHLVGYAQADINWLSIEEAIVLNEKTPKKVVLDVYTKWCGWCKKMDNTTFKDPKVVDFINKNYYAVKFDAEYKKDIIFKGKKYKYISKGKRGYHELAAFLLQGKLSYPSFVFLDDAMATIQPISSYIKAQKFLIISSYFAGDFYKTTPWNKYAKQYRKNHGLKKEG